MHLIAGFKNKLKSEILCKIFGEKNKDFHVFVQNCSSDSWITTRNLFSEYSGMIVLQSTQSLELDLELNQGIRIILNNTSSWAE